MVCSHFLADFSMKVFMVFKMTIDLCITYWLRFPISLLKTVSKVFADSGKSSRKWLNAFWRNARNSKNRSIDFGYASNLKWRFNWIQREFVFKEIVHFPWSETYGRIPGFQMNRLKWKCSFRINFWVGKFSKNHNIWKKQIYLLWHFF